MYDDEAVIASLEDLNTADKIAQIFDERIELALQKMQAQKAPPPNEEKKKTVAALQELARKVQSGEVTGLVLVSVGPNPQPGYAYADGQTGMGGLLGEIELIKGRIVNALIAPPQQQKA